MVKITGNSIKIIIYIEIVFVLVYQILVSHLGLPSSISYLCDVCNVPIIIYVLNIKNKQKLINSMGARSLLICVIALTVVITVSDLINVVRPALILAAYRNTYRFFLFFLACLLVLEKDDIEKIFSIMYKLQVVNVLLTLYQYFILHKSQDYLGGIFGMQAGCNAYTNIYLCLLLVYVLVKYVYKKGNVRELVWIIVSSLMIAALAELKVFFVEFVLIILLAIVLSRPSAKTIKILAFSAIGFVMGLNVFSKVFPEAYADLINIDQLIEYNTTVIWGYNISRWGAFRQINELFFNGSILLNLLGLGFGNCEYSVYPIFTSDFYHRYGNYHYRWFAHQTWFLEGGYLGFGLFLLFFILVFIWGTKIKSRMEGAREYALMAQLTSVVTIISLWYNASSRVEIAYILFFALAAPYIAFYHTKQKV